MIKIKNETILSDVTKLLFFGLINFLVSINICSFVFIPYKNKSHFLVPTKFFVSVFSPS